jgi:acetyl-CoA carboxylase carboxyl transferase subunit alpha
MKERELRRKLAELKELASREQINIHDEIQLLESKLAHNGNHTGSAWQTVKTSRLVDRPTSLDYINLIFDDFMELHGDRFFSDDPAMIGGIAKLNGRPVTVIGQQRGRNLKENLVRNGGMALPDGYRKALRLVRQAEKFGRPVISLVDTGGAYPGVAAEERGIGEAIAHNLREFFSVKTPIIIVIIGQGGSGGALGIGIGDVVYMLQNAIYSVISPEGCATILWRSAEQSQLAAVAMKVTAGEQQELGIVDAVILEPGEGAHTDPAETARRIKEAVIEQLDALGRIPLDELVEARFKRYRAYGPFSVADRSAVPTERPGIADRLRGLLTGRPFLPASPGTRRGGPSDREEV